MMYFVYLLCVLWSLGCFGLPLWAGFSMVRDPWDRGMGIAILLLGWPIGCFIAVLPWAFIAQERSPDLATLKKNEWACSASHTQITTTYVMVGKVMTPMVQSHQVCDQYNRRQ